MPAASEVAASARRPLVEYSIIPMMYYFDRRELKLLLPSWVSFGAHLVGDVGGF